ncbi:MAG: FAD-dependent oxidoreductase [Tepidisphaeraceae bacterium]
MIRAEIALATAMLVIVCHGFVVEARGDTPGMPLWQSSFSDTPYGNLPDGWRDLVGERPSRGWIVDGNGLLRQTRKPQTGLLAYEGETADGQPARALGDAVVTATFKKTEDEAVSFGVAGRIVDRNNYYLARLRGTDRLELIKVKDGQPLPLDFAKPGNDAQPRPTGQVTLKRYREGDRWRLALTMRGDRLTAQVFDDTGAEQARLDAVDAEFGSGRPGLCCTRFAAAASFRIDAPEPFEAKGTPEQLAKRIAEIAAQSPVYPLAKPHWKIDEINTPREKLQANYDTVVAGGGTGGWAAAMQAARLGNRVLLLEETDWLGGQMASAAVATMDEDGLYGKFPVRERGLYREFNESMVAYYQTLDKDPFVAYYSYPDQEEGGYEPKAVRAVLYGLIKEARDRGSVLDLSVRSRVVAVAKQGDAVTGATVEFLDEAGTSRKEIASKILIDATEYGDVIPLTGARYRTGNATSDKPNPAALVQDDTWLAVVREYPGGVPEHLKIKSPPPGYEGWAAKKYKNYQRHGFMLWGGAGKNIKGNRDWRVYFAWRGMADADSPLTGERSNQRHTQCGYNGGNDYPVTSATLEDPAQRLIDEREGIYRTLGTLYYFQNQLGVNWSLAEDEGYNTLYNRDKIKRLDLRPDLASLAVYMPQHPYVRESRRIMGVRTLVADDLTRFEQAKLFPTSVAMGDYFMDLDHGDTSKAIETDLDDHDSPKGGGTFQVPFEVFIPEKIDGFVPAEKNISQSRIASGATRLQPITILTGQAAGTIAALAVKQGKQPRELNALAVQRTLLDSGCTLVQRWHSDVPWRSPVWKATQLLSLYQVMDRTGPLTRDREQLAAAHPWGVNEPLKADELHAALKRLAELTGVKASVPSVPRGTASQSDLAGALRAINADWPRAMENLAFADPSHLTAGEFAQVAARILVP